MENKFNDKIRIQDDLYKYVNGKWIENAKIPDDLPAIGGFINLDLDVEKTMLNEFEELSKNKIDDQLLNYSIILYKKVLDEDNRKNGLNSLLNSLSIFDKIKNKEDFLNNIYSLWLNSLPLPFTSFVNEDMMEATKYSLYFNSPSLILPDSTMYSSLNAETLLNIYKVMVSKILNELNIKNSDDLISKTISFDNKLSKIVKSSEEMADYIKCYNPYPYKKVCELMDLKLDDFLIKTFGKIPETIVLYNPKFIENFKDLFNNNFEEYLSWAKVKTIVNNVQFISEELRNLSSQFSNTLRGTNKIISLKKYAYQIANSFYDEVIGIYYGKKYFGEEAKKDVINIVKNLIRTYKERLSSNSWLSKETIKKAILKLDTMNIKIGYPDMVSESYKKLIFNKNDSLFEIISDLTRIKKEYNASLLFKPVDKSLWVMSGNTVNACYNPTSNDITFPAAILRKPFYSLSQSVEENYGGIGCVIGHEISHAFDNNGAQMDEKGNINNWWTNEDYDNFKKKTELMIEQFDNLPLGNEKVNGKLTVSENIADNGGVTSSIESLKRIKDNPDFKKFFINYARIWCMKQREEYTKLLLTVDVHGPAYYRANMQVKNFDEFYRAFDIKDTDKMYLEPSKRLIIW